MNLDEFLHNLHFDIDKVRPVGFEVDWADAPLSYKLYRGLPIVSLSSEISLNLEQRDSPIEPSLHDISNFLWYIFGLTQFCQSIGLNPVEEQLMLMQSFRRFVPSGGGLYPNELYVYLKIVDVPVGVYHYDVAHHRLVLLREGNYDTYITKALGQHSDRSSCFGTVFVSTMFWKNFFKYNNFAYRLQGMDTGVLIGQLQEVAKRFCFTATVHHQFLDRALNHLLGLSDKEESIYAVISLSNDSETNWVADRNGYNETALDTATSATSLCHELADVQHDSYNRSQRVLEYPMLTRINDASQLESLQSFHKIGDVNDGNNKIHVDPSGKVISLPDVEPLSFDLAEVCRHRYSPGMDYRMGSVNQIQIATLLHETMDAFFYRNDLDKENANSLPRVSLYGCFYKVEGIPDGAYCYESDTHTLRLIQPGDHRYKLQESMTMHNVNLFQVPICLHVVGDNDHLKPALGFRGYRIQQMEAGMLVQKLLLTAVALGMGGHPILGFEAGMCDQIYKLDVSKKTCLIQIPVGFHQFPQRLSGNLLS